MQEQTIISTYDSQGRREKRDAYRELFLDPVAIALTFRSEDGRPVGEENAPAYAQEGVEFRSKKCPFPGSRKGMDMNMSGFKHVTDHWDGIMGDLGGMRKRYMERNGLEEFNLIHFWRFAKTMTAIPTFLVRRQDDPLPRERVPNRFVGLYKTAQGLHMTPEHMIVCGAELDQAIDVELILDYTEEKKVAVNANRACAGPPGMIRDFVTMAIEGEGDHAPDGVLEQTVGDMDRALDYGEAISNLVVVKVAAGCENRLLLHRLKEAIEALDGAADDPRTQAFLEQIAESLPIPRVAPSATIEAIEGLFNRLAAELARYTGGGSATPSGAGEAGAPSAAELMERFGAGCDAVPPQVLELCLKALPGYLAAERRWIAYFEACHHAIARALGRQPHAEHLDGDDISAIYGRRGSRSGEWVPSFTLRDIVSRWLGVRIRNLHDRAIFQSDAGEMVLRPAS